MKKLAIRKKFNVEYIHSQMEHWFLISNIKSSDANLFEDYIKKFHLGNGDFKTSVLGINKIQLCYQTSDSDEYGVDFYCELSEDIEGWVKEFKVITN